MVHRSSKQIQVIVFGYVAISMLAALLTPAIPRLWCDGLIASIPTVATLTANGDVGGGGVPGYFLVMYALLPVTAACLTYCYPGSEGTHMGTGRLLGSLAFFLGALILLAWFAFLLPPDGDYRGTRIRLFVLLASTSKIWLGLMYGIIFTCMSLLLMLSARYAWWLFNHSHRH